MIYQNGLAFFQKCKIFQKKNVGDKIDYKAQKKCKLPFRESVEFQALIHCHCFVKAGFQLNSFE